MSPVDNFLPSYIQACSLHIGIAIYTVYISNLSQNNMNDSYIEAQESIRNDEYQGDREREYERREHQSEPILKKILGKDWSKFFKEEQYHDHYQDNLI